jgi:hypothetical protein
MLTLRNGYAQYLMPVKTVSGQKRDQHSAPAACRQIATHHDRIAFRDSIHVALLFGFACYFLNQK